jgi:hypothetical protein
MEHHALQEIDECRTLLGGDLSRMTRRRPKGRLVRCEPIVFELDWLALGIGAYKLEVTVIGDENLAVFLSVFRYLGAVGLQEGIVAGGLGFDAAARRFRAWERFLG